MKSDTCVSQKKIYESEELALDALVQNHARNEYRAQKGPRNIYRCADCGNWHFTSKGEFHTHLLSSEIQDHIKKERRALEWERKMR